MTKNRLEAFSDGVIAIIITIMVLAIKLPDGVEISDLLARGPIFLSYVLSFIFVAVYWNNHHHLLHVAKKVNGRVLWANSHLLFWLSLMPFVTDWMGQNNFPQTPVVVYGVVMGFCGLAYYLLSRALVNANGPDSDVALAVGSDRKGFLSLVLILLGVGLSFVNTLLGFGFYVLVTLIWFIPDRRIEQVVNR
jgi:uncharacterized membrane protein